MLLNIERAIPLFVDKQEITMNTKTQLLSCMLSLAVAMVAVGVTTTAEAHQPGCPKWVRGCYHPLGNIGDHPGNPKGTGHGVPNTGINCTYTTHGLCSPD